MKPSRLLCLVNPRSGGYRGSFVAEQFRAAARSGREVEVVALGESSAVPARGQIEAGFSDVLIAGGDGTFSSLLPGFAGSPLSFHLLALGTGNDLPRELGVSRLWRGSAERFIDESFALDTVPLTVWEAVFAGDGGTKTISFLNYISFGWDGLVVEHFEKMRKGRHTLAGRFGPWGNRILYGYSALRIRPTALPAVTLTTGAGQRELRAGSFSVIVANIGSIMGLAKLARTSDCTDSKLEVFAMRNLHEYVSFLLPFDMRFAGRAEVSHSEQELTLSFASHDRPLPLQIDGEAGHGFRGGKVSFRVLGHVNVRSRRRR